MCSTQIGSRRLAASSGVGRSNVSVRREGASDGRMRCAKLPCALPRAAVCVVFVKKGRGGVLPHRPAWRRPLRVHGK